MNDSKKHLGQSLSMALVLALSSIGLIGLVSMF